MGPCPEERSHLQEIVDHGLGKTDCRSTNTTTSVDEAESKQTSKSWVEPEGYTALFDFNNDSTIDSGYVMVSTGLRDSDDDDDDDDDDDKHQSNAIDYNFEEIAANAVSSLDQEYMRTLTVPTAIDSNEKQDDEDIKIIANIKKKFRRENFWTSEL